MIDLPSHFSKINRAKLVICSLAIALCSANLSAQLDPNTKRNQIDSIVQLAVAEARENREAATGYALQSLAMAESIGYQIGIANSYLAYARIHIITNQYDAARSALSSAENLISSEQLDGLISKLLEHYGWLAQREKDFEQSLDYLWKAKEALKDPITSLGASINTNLGTTHYYMSELDSSLFYYQEALDIAISSGDSVRMLNGLRNVGIVLRRKGHIQRAVDLYYRALSIADGLQLRSGQADLHNSLGVSYDQLKDYEKALHHYKYSLELRRQLGDKKRLANVLSNIGWIYSELGQLDEALASHLEALEISDEIGGHTSRDAIYNNIGLVYKSLGELNLAWSFFDKSRQEYEDKGDYRGVVIAVNNLASVHFANEQYQKTIELQKEYLPMLQQHGELPTKLNAFERLYMSYEEINDQAEALKYHIMLKMIADSIFDIDKQAEVYELASKYETDKKAIEIKLKNTEIKNLEQKATLQNRTFWTYAISVSCIGMLLIGFVYYRNGKQKRELEAKNALFEARLNNEELEKEKAQFQHDARKKELLSFALNVTQKNELLRRLSEVLRKKMESNSVLRDELRELEGLIHSNDRSEKDWQNFKSLFEQLHHQFFGNLKAKHGDLTAYEVRLAAFILLNLSNDEIASMLNISISSLTSARYRLRKKLGLTGKNDIATYLTGFNQ